jgi:hypothetical protein
MSTQANPYAPPMAPVADVSSADSHAEAIRREHIKHEASVRSIGGLYLFGGVLGTLGGIALLASTMGVDEQRAIVVAAGAAYVLFSVLSLVVGLGLRKLQPWTRIATIAFSCFGLLAIPIGTLINGYILYLMVAAKGKRIFTPDYAAIIAATPHIKYRTSLVLWIAVGLLFLGIGAAIVVPMLSR